MMAFIIDDDNSSFMVLKKMLKSYLDIDATGYSSTENIEESVKELHPCVIFLDLFLGSESGFSFLTKRSKSQELRKIPVVMTSGSSQMDAISTCLRNGANSYLIKPVQKDILISTVLKLDMMTN